jgi:hypothetical protein
MLSELAPEIRAEPGCPRHSAHPTGDDADGPVLVLMEFTSPEAFAARSTRIARQVPRLAELLHTPPATPALFGPDASGSTAANALLPA